MGTQFFLKRSNHSFPQTKATQLETVFFCSGNASLTQRIGASPALEVYLPTSTISQHQAQHPQHSGAQQTLLLWHGPCSQDQESQALLMFLSHQWAHTVILPLLSLLSLPQLEGCRDLGCDGLIMEEPAMSAIHINSPCYEPPPHRCFGPSLHSTVSLFDELCRGANSILPPWSFPSCWAVELPCQGGPAAVQGLGTSLWAGGLWGQVQGQEAWGLVGAPAPENRRAVLGSVSSWGQPLTKTHGY